MRGTPEQFEEVVKAKIAELGGYQDIESSEDIYGYDEFDDDEFASNYDDEYFDELLDELNSASRLREYDFDLFPGDNSVTLNVGYEDEDGNNTIVALDIPYSDLSLDFGGIDDDVRYITRYIQRELR